MRYRKTRKRKKNRTWAETVAQNIGSSWEHSENLYVNHLLISYPAATDRWWETRRSQHFWHIVPSHIMTTSSQDAHPKLLNICRHILSPERGVRVKLLSFDILIGSAFLYIFLHPYLYSSSPSIGDNISPPQWEWFEGIQLNESMIEEGGYFRECHFFQPLASFPGFPLLSPTSQRVEH